jgi:methylmalonyl-CoA mutase N-terminal domain/subunit
MIKSLRKAFEAWKKGALAKSLQRRPERKGEFKTSSDIPVEPLYIPRAADLAYGEQIGFPGEYPYTRGIQATMYRGRVWTMRQYAGYASAQEGIRFAHPNRLRRR